MKFLGLSVGILLLGLASCTHQVIEAEEVPADYVDVEAQIHLGQLLFFEGRLSKDNTVGCVTCHLPGLAFTDGLAKSEGVGGRFASRNAPTLFNLADHQVFMFDGVIPSLEVQALSPISDHNEMDSSMKEIIEKLKDDPVFRRQFKKAYMRPMDPKGITEALAAFQKTLVSTSSRFDAFYFDKKSTALSDEEKKGWDLFSNKFNCVSCHALPHFTNAQPESNGLPIADEDYGRYRATSLEKDKGKFKVPSLRNLSVTGPYMHDGRMTTLDEVLLFYGNQQKSIYADPRVKDYKMSTKERQQIVSFLLSLKDTVLF